MHFAGVAHPLAAGHQAEGRLAQNFGGLKKMLAAGHRSKAIAKGGKSTGLDRRVLRHVAPFRRLWRMIVDREDERLRALPMERQGHLGVDTQGQGGREGAFAARCCRGAQAQCVADQRQRKE